MAEVTASLVKELRDRTGLGMMECKKALQEAGADIELAIDNLRKSGQAKAAKKAGNIAAEGAIILASDGNTAIALEVNCQTDFVARDVNFTAFANKVAGIALAARETNAEKISALDFDGMSVEEARVLLVQKLGENIQVRRAEIVEGAALATYVHGLKIGVIVAFNKADDEISKQLAMHVAASNPLVINADDIPADVLAKEQEIAAAKAAESGKPANIVEKMVEGTLKKFRSEVSLTEQAFVIDPDQKVGAVLAKAGLTVERFIRLEVGEGIERKEVDFAAEVAATQAAAAAAK